MTHHNGELKHGMIVRVKKGSLVRSYHPRFPRTGKLAGKSYNVKIHHFIGDQVNWEGSSGYWTWTHKDNVTIVEHSFPAPFVERIDDPND